MIQQVVSGRQAGTGRFGVGTALESGIPVGEYCLIVLFRFTGSRR